MSKSRRDKFEEQLRALQTDINHLSYKMAVPATQSMTSSTQHLSPQRKSTLKRDTDGRSSPPKSSQKSSMKQDRNEDSSYFSSQRNDFDLRLNNSIPVGEVSNGYRENGLNHMPEKEYGYKEDLGDVYALTRERNDLFSRLEQSQKEIEELRKAVIQSRDLQIQHDRLIQDHNSVQISLESSERIRRQQKELINLLQRSAAVAENTQDFSLGASLSPSTTSTAAENRSWLNAFSNTNSKGSGDVDTESLSISNQGRGDDFRREEMFVPEMHRDRSSQLKPKTNGTNTPKIKRKSSTLNRETLSSSARQTNVSTRTNKSISGAASSSGVGSTRHVTNTIPTNTKVSARQQSHQRSNLALASPSATPGYRGVTNGRQHTPISRLDEQLASSIESLGLINKSHYNHSDGYSPVFESQSLSDNRLLAPDYPHHTRSVGRQPQASGTSSQRPRSAPPSSPTPLKSNRSPAIEGKTRRASASKGIADLNSTRNIYNGTENRRNDQEVDRDSKRDTRLVGTINSTLHSRNGRPPITPTYTSDKYHLNQYSYPHSAH